MCDTIEAILLSPDSFCEAALNSLKEEGLSRAWIIKFIGAESLNCEVNQQFEVVLTIFYHLVDELYSKGCTKAEIGALARLTGHYWHDSLDRSLQENLQCLHAALEPLVPAQVSQRSAEIYLKYIVQSFLQHFNLYRACLAERRPDLRLRRSVTAEAPDAPLPLREGRRPEEHEYHCQLKEIDTEEQLARGVQLNRRLEEAAELARRQREVEDRAEAEEEVEVHDDEYPNSLIGDCIELNLRQMRLKVLDMAENSSIDLIYKAKRTALPRPANLGPPPRYAANSAINAGSGGGGDKKSTTSSRSSAKSKRGAGDAVKKAAKVK